MSFLEKNWQKKAADEAVKAAMRIVGASATAYVTKKLTSDESTNAKKTIKNISSPLITVAGVLGSMMIADPNIKAICEGIATFGAVKTISVFMPSVGEAVGLQGVQLQDKKVIMNGIGVRRNRLNGLATPGYSKEDYKPIMNGNVAQNSKPVFQQAQKNGITL